MLKKILYFFLIIAIWVQIWLQHANANVWWYRLKVELHFFDEYWNVPNIRWNDIVYYSVSANWKRWAKPLAKWKIWDDWVVVLNMKNKIAPTTIWMIYFITNNKKKDLEEFLIPLDDSNIKEEESIWVNWIDYLFWKANVILKQRWETYDFLKFKSKKKNQDDRNEEEVVVYDDSLIYTFKVDEELIPWKLKFQDYTWEDIILPVFFNWEKWLKELDINLNDYDFNIWDFYNISFSPSDKTIKEYWMTINFSSKRDLLEQLKSFNPESKKSPKSTEEWVFPYFNVWIILFIIIIVLLIIKRKKLELLFLRNNFLWNELFKR